MLQAGIIYPISDSTWVSPTQVVPKKSGVTTVKNEKGEELSTRLTTSWRVCIDYRRLNEVTRKDHFPLPFIDQLLERVSGHPYYCFLDGYSGYFQIEIAPEDKEKTTFTCPFGTYAYRRMSECAHTVGQFKPQQPNAPYGNTYNPNWRNHPNLAWRPNPPPYVPLGAKPQFGSPSQSQQPPSSSPVEQAILNLSKVVGNFVEEQKGINVQLAQRIDTVENTLNKKIDGLESNLKQKMDNLQYSITNINKLLDVQEKERFPSQTLPNPKGIHEVGSGMDEVKSIITWRSGKEVDQPLPKPVEESRQGEEMQPEHILLEEDTMKYRIPPPFPQALRGKKKAT